MSFRDLGSSGQKIRHTPSANDTTCPDVSGILDASVATLTALRAVTPVAGQSLSLLAYATEGDGGGGIFEAEASVPASATITNVTTTSKVISGATNATPIVITTTTNHGLNTGHSVKIASVGGNTNANGNWLITKLSAITFSLNDSAGNASYTSGGTATYGSITLATDTTFILGAVAIIAGVAGATGVNGTWFPVGYDAITGTLITIPCDTTSAYMSGSVVGDGGISIPTTAGTKRWLRKNDGKPYNVKWWGAKGDNSADDTAAVHGCVRAGEVAKRDIFIPSGTYKLYYELLVSTFGNRIFGEGSLVGGSTPHVTLKASRTGMRSLISLAHTDQDIRDLRLNGDLKSKYCIHFQIASQTQMKRVFTTKAIFDGFHLTDVRDDGNAANNDFMSAEECSAYLIGTVFASSGYTATYTGGGYQLVLAPGTVSCTFADDTITGTSTTFTTEPKPRKGDFIRIGPPATAITLEILSGDSNTQITVQPNSLPTQTFTNEDYAVCVGDGWHEQRANDNNRAYIRGGLFRGIAGSGIVARGLYGPIIIKPQLDTIGAFGIVVGALSSYAGTITTVIQGAYHEGSASGVAGCYLLANALGIDILQPLLGNAADDRRIVINEATLHNIGSFTDEFGKTSFFGRQVLINQDATEEYKLEYVTQGCGMNRAHASVFSSVPAEPVHFVDVPIIGLDHVGKIDVDIVGAYSGGGGGGGARVLSYGYTYVAGVLTVGTVDDATPANQVDANLPDPTFQLRTVNSRKVITTDVYGNTSGVDNGNTLWDGEVKIRMAGYG